MMQYMVRYVRRPRVSRAWGRKTKAHRLYLVFESRADAYAVMQAVRRWKNDRDSMAIYRTDKPVSDVSVEDASKSLWRWQSEPTEKSRGQRKSADPNFPKIGK